MQSNLDKSNFTLTLLLIGAVSIPLVVDPVNSAQLILEIYAWIADQFGWLYAAAGIGALGLLCWLAFSRFGAIKLGQADETPEFTDLSWIAMLFSAGVGAGLMYWSAIEWSYYFESPPFAAEPYSVQAASWASSYGMFHWGLTAWAFYCLPTLAIAYPFYRERVPVLKYSLGCHYWLKGREESIPARVMDGLFMLALIGGAGSSLGFSTPLISSLIARLTGIPAGFPLETGVVLLCVVIFATSVYLGLEKGIKRLSDLNMVAALLLLAFVVVAGPSLFIFKTSLNSLGTLLQNYISMSFWTDPFTDSGFFEEWTVFYWAWWIAYGPFVGLFVTRISRGRSFREVILGMLTYGSLGGALFYMVLGNYSLELQLSGKLDILAIKAAQGESAAIVAGFDQLPLAEFAIALFCFVSIVFSATTYDSAAYTLASSATQRLQPGEDPPRWHRCFWAMALAVLPLSLMYVGGLKVAQTAVLVASLPILITLTLSTVALLKSIDRDYPRSSTG